MERTDSPWTYFPIALAVKWPLGFLGALALRAARRLSERPGRKRLWHESFLLVPVAVVLGSAMVAHLNVGIRYVFPMLPLLCVWCGGLLAPRGFRAPHRGRAGAVPAAGRARVAAVPAAGRRRVAALPALGVALAVLQGVEAVSASPWHLSFFNRLAGGPGGGYRVVNDSNVDWGQGLIALRDELRRRGIGKIHLAYHGTTDPAIYGIDYVPFLGGMPGQESDWIAVSSYYFVGLTQRMMTQQGRSERVKLDGPLRNRRPDAVVAGCMYLFRLR